MISIENSYFKNYENKIDFFLTVPSFYLTSISPNALHSATISSRYTCECVRFHIQIHLYTGNHNGSALDRVNAT